MIPFEENQSAKYVNSGIFVRKVRRIFFVTFKPLNISNSNIGKEIGNNHRKSLKLPISVPHESFFATRKGHN